MPLIGMSEAGKRTGYTPAAVRRLLQSDGVALVPITARAYAVEESDLEAFILRRGVNPGPGRPRKETTETTLAQESAV
jgi:hypothetical protein